MREMFRYVYFDLSCACPCEAELRRGLMSFCHVYCDAVFFNVRS